MHRKSCPRCWANNLRWVWRCEKCRAWLKVDGWTMWAQAMFALGSAAVAFDALKQVYESLIG